MVEVSSPHQALAVWSLGTSDCSGALTCVHSLYIGPDFIACVVEPWIQLSLCPCCEPLGSLVWHRPLNTGLCFSCLELETCREATDS